MTREACKHFLDNGIFQAYANGEPVYYLGRSDHEPLSFGGAVDNYSINSPFSWNNMPAWVNFIARDEGGSWWGFPSKPLWDVGRWISNESSTHIPDYYAPPITTIAEYSLIKRNE